MDFLRTSDIYCLLLKRAQIYKPKSNPKWESPFMDDESHFDKGMLYNIYIEIVIVTYDILT